MFPKIIKKVNKLDDFKNKNNYNVILPSITGYSISANFSPQIPKVNKIINEFSKYPNIDASFFEINSKNDNVIHKSISSEPSQKIDRIEYNHPIATLQKELCTKNILILEYNKMIKSLEKQVKIKDSEKDSKLIFLLSENENLLKINNEQRILINDLEKRNVQLSIIVNKHKQQISELMANKADKRKEQMDELIKKIMSQEEEIKRLHNLLKNN